MAKNILIYLDGTGMAGGITFDEDRTATPYRVPLLADTFIKPVFGAYAAREADNMHEHLGKPLEVADAAKGAIIGTIVGSGAK